MLILHGIIILNALTYQKNTKKNKKCVSVTFKPSITTTLKYYGEKNTNWKNKAQAEYNDHSN